MVHMTLDSQQHRLSTEIEEKEKNNEGAVNRKASEAQQTFEQTFAT